MITDRLRAVVDSAAQLPPEAQDKVAAQLERAVRNALWDAQLGDPQYDHILEELIARADEQEPLHFPVPQGWTEADDADDTE
jgi:uncharacterized protein (DUF2267 family)